MLFYLKPKAVLHFLLSVTGLLLLFHLASQVFLFNIGWHMRCFWAIKLFDFGREMNIPTLFSSLLLVFASVLFWTISRIHQKSHKPHVVYWSIMSYIFLFLAIDESAMIHENLIIPLRHTFDASGLLYFSWVIPYGLLLVFGVLVFYRFINSIPEKTRKLIICAGIVYVLGALGFEMLGGFYADLYSTRTITYSLLVMFEETLEMSGLSLLVFALFSYLETLVGSITIQFSEQ